MMMTTNNIVSIILPGAGLGVGLGEGFPFGLGLGYIYFMLLLKVDLGQVWFCC